MRNKTCFAILFILVLSLGCASTSHMTRPESVTIILNNGDRIEADILDLFSNKVVFKAKDWKKAYEYGEVLNGERIAAVELGDGRRLSLSDYERLRDGERVKAKKETGVAKRDAGRKLTPQEMPPGDNLHYEELQTKPISEMTENEFAYFMMMKEREMAGTGKSDANEKEGVKAAGESVPEAEIVTVIGGGAGLELLAPRPVSADNELSVEAVPVAGESADQPQLLPLAEMVTSLVEAQLAPAYLSYLYRKMSGQRPLLASEAQLFDEIEKSPSWQAELDELSYLDRTARKSMERAYLYNPEELETRLALELDRDLDPDYSNLMAQLHRRIGNDVKMGDFRSLVEVFGESGGRAMREILENYDAWLFVTRNNNFVAEK